MLLSPSNRLRQEASSKGLSLDNYLVQILKHAAHISQKNKGQKQLSETDLLKKINLGITEAEWAIYKHLIVLRREERLTEQEHQELINLGDKIEQANAQRLEYLFELSQLRGVSLQKVMTDLGIKPVEV